MSILLTLFIVDFCHGDEIFGVKIERFGDETVENEVVKKADGTKIKIPEKNRWNDDFKERFEGFEDPENLKMASLLPDFLRNHHVIDTGAHVGDTGLYLALKAREIGRDDIKIIMIEPDKSKVEYINLLADINGLTNVVTMNYGLGMIHSQGSLDRSIHPGGWTVKTDSNEGEFIVERLDALITRRYHQIGLMHIDVEGMEHQVLLGADRLLNTTRYVMIELNGLSDRSKERELLGDRLFKMVAGGKGSGYTNGNELYRRI
tara:strand:- start:5171 stop:5953 length:783 start_codon:yes stop_codon:yes gene_type:complete